MDFQIRAPGVIILTELIVGKEMASQRDQYIY